VQSTVESRGISPVLQIPPAVLEAAGMGPGQRVHIRAEGTRVVISLAHYDIGELGAGITDENRHESAW